MKTKLSIAAGFLLGGFLLYFAFRNIDFVRMLEICRGAAYIYIIPLVFTIIAELFLRGVKWKLLLDPAAPVRVWDAFRLEAAGLALNNILPLRLGELARGTLGAKLFNIPLMTVFATILVERVLDLVILFVLLAAAARLGGVSGGFLDHGAYLWAVFGGVTGAVVALVFIDELMAHHFFAGFFAGFPRLKKLLSQLALGLNAFHAFKTAVLIFVVAAVQWLLDALNCYWMAKAFGIENIIGPAKSVVLVFTGAVACSVPGMPGYFGNYEAVIAGLVAAWGVPKETGLAYAASGHVIGYLLITVIGLVFVYQMGQSLGRVWAQFGGGADVRRKT